MGFLRRLVWGAIIGGGIDMVAKKKLLVFASTFPRWKNDNYINKKDDEKQWKLKR